MKDGVHTIKSQPNVFNILTPIRFKVTFILTESGKSAWQGFTDKETAREFIKATKDSSYFADVKLEEL